MPIINRIAAFHDEMKAWRHDLHRHPELALKETRTSAMVQQKLRSFGVDEVVTGIAGTGVVGIIRGAGEGDAIGLRADMDALPISEQTGAPYASENPGVMHACGHDGHTAMLLGAAKYLAETRNFAGTAYMIFQPAEEEIGGGRIMVEEGLFERFPMARVFGLHNWPSAPEGRFIVGAGPVMAAVGNFDIRITGRGTHGAQPHRGNDPVVIAAHIITALQAIISRQMDPTEKGVVTVTRFAAGTAYNVIPETVTIGGTARWFTPSVGVLLEERIARTASGMAAAFGAHAETRFERQYPATVNDEAATELARHAAEAVAPVDALAAPSMGAEDFSFMLNAKQGSYIMLGSGRSPAEPSLHHPRYDFNDAILPLGASYWATLVEQQLRPAGAH